MIEALTHLLHDLVLGVHVRIHGESPLEQTLDLLVDDLGDEPHGPVIRHGASLPHLSCLVHQGPGHRGPLRPQQAEGGEVPDAALDEPLAPLVAAEKPEPVHQSRVARLRRCELKHLWVAVGVPREKQSVSLAVCTCPHLY